MFKCKSYQDLINPAYHLSRITLNIKFNPRGCKYHLRTTITRLNIHSISFIVPFISSFCPLFLIYFLVCKQYSQQLLSLCMLNKESCRWKVIIIKKKRKALTMIEWVQWLGCLRRLYSGPHTDNCLKTDAKQRTVIRCRALIGYMVFIRNLFAFVFIFHFTIFRNLFQIHPTCRIFCRIQIFMLTKM